jgi:hypothetical protein
LVLSLPLLGMAICATARADWDSLTRLSQAARDVDVSLSAPATLDLAHLSPLDAVVIVGPRRTLPINALTVFLREGGRVALFDDVGSGERLLSAYQVTRKPIDAQNVSKLREDPNLLIAYPASEHPLVDGVPLLLTNRAVALFHPDLRPVFAFGQFGQGNDALVLAGAVGAGRLVAVGDASVVIDQLMAIPAHERFAKNVLQYLARPAGKVWLVDADTEMRGSYGSRKAGLTRLDSWLRQASHPDLPESALLVLVISLLGIACILGAGILPRRSPYVRPDLFPNAIVFAGYAGRIAVAEQAGVNLVWSLLDYKRELEAELTRKLSPKVPIDRRELLARARSRGLGPDGQKELADLLAQLDALASKSEHDDGVPHVRMSDLGNVVRRGEALLARIGDDRE